MSREGKESRGQTGGRLPYRLLVRWVALIGAAFMLSFTGCGGSGWSGDHPDKNNYALTITPSSPVVTVGNTIHLTASSPWGSGAQWSVLPASAGSIDQNGNFTASNSPGTATIMAMWSEDVRYTATAAATVVAAPAASISVSAPPPGNTSETASVPLQPGSTYAWAIQGGSISAGQGTPQIQFIAGRVGPTQISCNVTDAAGDSAVSTFIVPPNIEYRPSTYRFIRGADIGSVIPANVGGAALSWQVTPNLPPGLLFDSNTGVITGTPGVPAPAATFTVTATNAGGASNPFALTITTIDSAPIFSYIPNTYVLTLNAAITAISPTLTHGTVTAWKISPALPAGLGLDSTTGRILGTPSVLAPNLTYTVTASNNWGSSTTEPISIAVVDVPPAISYLPSDHTFTRGSAVTPVLPTNTGGAATSWAIMPALPGGLVFDTSSGSVSGTPSVIDPAVSYVVTATNTGGTSAPANIRISVLDIVPEIQYPSGNLYITVNSAMAPFLPTNSGGPATSWNIQPAPPSGLVFDSATGAISGVPVIASAVAPYTITASNSGGTSKIFTLHLGAFLQPTAAISASSSNPAYGATVNLTPTFANAASAQVGTTQGGSDISSAPVSGVPIATAAITSVKTYWLRATNAAGDFVDSSVAVTPQSVIVNAITPANPTRTVNSMTGFTTTAAGGATNGITWSASAGTMNASTGSWTAPNAPGNVTITATSTDDSSKTATTAVNVVAAVTSSIGASSTNPPYGGTVNLTPTFANAATAQVGTTPGGSDISSAPVSGVPIATAAITSVKTYWLRATNAAGDFVDSSVTVTPQSVTVNAIAPANPTRTVNSMTGFTTTAAGGATNGITWSASAGTMNASTGSWTAPGTAGTVSITASSQDDETKTATTNVNVVNPATASISASPANPPYGATVNLTPTFTNAASAQVGTTQGGSDISSAPVIGVPIATAAITSVKTYWLRATNAAGDFVDSSVTVTPQSVTVNAITPANPTRTVNGSATFTTTATGGATNGITWSASAGTMNAGTGSWTAPNAPGNVTITATSTDDSSKTAATVVNVVAAVTSSMSASTTTPLYGATVNLVPTFANATLAEVGTTQGGSDISSSPVTGVQIATAAITSVKTYWLRATNAAGDFVDSSVTVTPQTVVINPITPAGPTRTVNGSATFTTTATGGATNGIAWSASAGTMNAGTGSWTAPGTPGSVIITATSTDDSSKTATTTANVVAAATASISASTTNPLYGATVNLTPTFANAASAKVGTTQGGSDISSAPTSGSVLATAAITSARTYWLRATNAAGDYADSSVTVTPQTVVVNAISPANSTVNVNSTPTFTTTAIGGVTNGITWSANGGTMNAGSGVWTAPAGSGTFTITATSKDDGSKSATTTVTVVLLPTDSISASSTNPLYGATVNLTPTFANAASAKVGTTQGGSDISSSPTSGVQIATTAITSATTFWLRATNAAGSYVDSSVAVTPQTPIISAITKSASNVSVGYTATANATVSNALDTSVDWTAACGSLSASNTASGANTTWTAPASPTSCVLTAKSHAYTTATSTATLTVVALPVATSLNVNNANPPYKGTVILTPLFSSGTGNVDHGVGVVTNNVGKTSGAITAATTFTLTVTNAAGQLTTVQSTLVTPQTVVLNPISPASPTITVSKTATFSATVTGGAANTIDWTATCGSFSPTNTASGANTTWTAPAAPQTCTLTAKSHDDTTKTTTTTATVVAMPTASITASTTTPQYGASVNLTPTFTGAVTASVGTTQGGNDISSAPTSGSAIATAAITSSSKYWLRATNAGGTFVDSSVTVNPQTVTIAATTAASTVSVGYTTTAQATVSNAVDTAVNWTATCGSFSPTNTASGANTTWTAPAAPQTCTLTASSDAESSITSSKAITVIALPVASSLTPSTSSPIYGATISLTPVFSNGTGAVDQGVGAVTSGVGKSSSALTSPTTFTLTVTNAAGQTATAWSGVVSPQTVAVTLPSPAGSYVSVGGTQSFSASAQNAVNAAVTWSSGGAGSWSGTAWTAPSTPGAYTITATSAADPTKSNSTTVNVVALPVIQSFSSAEPQVSLNHATTLTAVFTNGGGNAFIGTSGAGSSDISNSVATNTATSTGNLSAATTFTLTVYNLAGSSTAATLTVPVVVGSSTPTNPLSGAMYDHTSTLLPSGTVLIIGGQNGTSALNAAQLYDPVAASVSDAGTMNSARYNHTATLLPNNSVLVAGGDNGSTIAASEIWNGSFTATGSLNTPREKHTSGSFSSGPALSPARYGHTGTLLASGLVLLTGGSSDGATPLSNAVLYDPTIAGYWPTGSLNTSRFEPSSTILRNGHVLTAGGSSNPANIAPNALNSTEVYDPQDNLTPVLPSAVLTAPASAPNGSTGLVASVPNQNNVSYIWSLTNGSITSGLNTHAITFSIATAPSILSVLVVSDRQIPVQSSATINPAPSIASFTATPSTNTTGLTTTLAWSVSGGSGLTLAINNGVGTVTGSSSATVTTPASTTTYTLTATDSNGTTTRSVTLTAVPMPIASSLIAAVNPVEKGSSTTIVPVFTTNGSASINNGIGTVTSGLAYPTGTINATSTFTLSATNTVGTTATVSTTINVMPVVVGAITGPSNVTVSSTSGQYSATVTGAVNKGVTWSVSAGTITSAGVLTAPATPQDIVVTATSVADPSQYSQMTVHVVPVAIALSITAAGNPVLYGGSTTVTPTFSLGTATIDQGIGTVASGVAYTTGAITGNKTFTLTVTNASGDSATASVTVQPQAVVVSTITGPASGKVTQGHTATFSATATGAVNAALTWSSGGAGSWSGATWTAPNSPGTYTITATAVNGSSNTLSITVVAAAAITAFAAVPPGINKNQSSVLTATFTGAGTGSNANGVVTPGNLALGSGTAGVSTGGLTASQTYTLTVTNDAGDSATAQTTVQVFLGQFTATANHLAAPRNLPTATLRADGNVLVAGGGSGSANTDLFDGTALTFAPATPLLTGRNGQTATLLPNGLILIAGGSNGATALATAEIYNPANGSLSYTGSLAHARQNHRAILLDSGKVLVVGGAGLSSAEVYDPATGSFSAANPMASVRDSATVSRLPDGRILVAGGSNGSTRLATAEIYDPSTNSFSTAASMLAARQLHTATTLPSGQILIAGGTGSTGSGSAEIFNPSLMRFVSTANMIQPRQEHIAAQLAGGMVLIAGGNSGVTPNAIDQAELFDPSSGTFQKTDFMSDAGAAATGAAASILTSGQVVVTGGTMDGSTVVPGSELYTPTDGIPATAANAGITVAPYVAQGTANVAAHVTAASGARYIWMVTNGTLVSGQGTSSITFNMPATGNATLDVLIVTNSFVPSHGQAVVVGEPAPVITSFTAALNPVLYGGSTTLAAVFSNATASAVIGTGAAGSSDVTASAVSATPVAISPITQPTQYRLTLTNRAGVSVNQTVTVGVQSVIVSAITPSAPTVSAGAAQTFTANVSHAVNTGIRWSANGGVMDPSSGSWTAPSTPGPYTITATSAGDGVTSSSTTATVVALPAIQSFTASPSTVNYGQAASLTAVFTGAAGNEAQIGTSGAGSAQLTAAATSGNAVPTGGVVANTTYTLTVTNAAGSSVTQTAQVNVNQPFSATGPMNYARMGQTTTSLPAGAILVAGGTGGPDPGELYSGGTFTATASPMMTARANHTATLLANGQVLFAGGTDASGNAQNTAELYDPATGLFTATAGNMVRARQNHVAALLPDGTVLIAGGFNATNQQLSDAEIFNPVTGAFSSTSTSLASARQFATATTLSDGRVLIAGGFNGTSHLATAQIFANGSFAAQEIAMGSARSHHVATLLPSGQVLLAGGYDGSSQVASSVLFKPGSPDTFISAGAMATARQDATAVLLADGNVLAAGGSNGTGDLSAAELFQPSGNTFVGTGNMVTPRSSAGSRLLLDGTVLVDGGTSDGTTRLTSAEIFNPQDGQTPLQPNATLTPSVSHAYAQATGLTASAPALSGNTYVWMIQNGAVTAGQGTNSITFSMASSGNAVIDLLVVSDHGVPAHGRATVASDALPDLASFTANAGLVPYGSSVTLTAVFSNANPVTLGTTGTNSSDVSSSVTSGQGILVGPLTATTTYTLTLPPANGSQTIASLTINVQPVVISSIAPALPNVSAGHSIVFNAAVSQAVNTAVTWTASGGTITNAGVWTAPSTPGTYTVTATAAANSAVTTSTTVTVVNLPTIDSLTASSGSVNYGQATTITPVFTAPNGSTAVIGTSGAGSSQVTGNATSGTGISTGPLTANTTFTLTVTNSAGDAVSQSAQVTVISPFSATGPMALARTGQTVTPLADGTVLVAGGTGAADVAEIYTAGSGRFASTAGAMQAARKNHTATLLADGRVLLTGGFDGNSVLSSAEIYDPSTQTFTLTAGAMLHARQHHAAVLLGDGRVLIVGGSNPIESQLTSAEIFDPATGAFTAASSSLQEAREFSTATAMPNGDVLVAGGSGTSGSALASAELFTGGSFLPQSFPMLTARTQHSATLLTSGQVLLAGGASAGYALQSAETYSGGSTAASFSAAAGSLFAARQQHTGTVLASGKVLIAGGSDGVSLGSTGELFDPASGTFEANGNLVTSRVDAGAALLQNGTVLLVGGTDANSLPLASAEIFNPQDSLTPALPALGLVAPDTAAFGSSQNAAITLPQGARCVWWVENGTLTGALNGSLNFTMGSSGNTTIHVLVYTNVGLPIVASKVVVGQ